MAGLMEQPQQQAAPGGQIDPRLAQIQEQIRAKIKPEDQSTVDRFVLAGKKFLFSRESRDIVLGQLQKGGDPAEAIAQGVAALISILDREVKGQRQPQAYVPAGMILLTEALDFASQSGLMELSDDIIAKATQDLAAFLMQKFGLNPDGSSNGQQPDMQSGAPPMQQPQAPQQTPQQPGLIQGAM